MDAERLGDRLEERRAAGGAGAAAATNGPAGRCAFSDLTELEVYGAPAG